MPTRCVIDENDIAEDCKAQNVEFQFLNFELPMGKGGDKRDKRELRDHPCLAHCTCHCPYQRKVMWQISVMKMCFYNGKSGDNGKIVQQIARKIAQTS